MNYINFTPRSIISLLVSAALLCNTAAPAFAQSRPHTSLPRTSQMDKIIAQKTDQALRTDAIRVPEIEQQHRIWEANLTFANGSLTQAQLGRLLEIGRMFTPFNKAVAGKSDFEQFQDLYTQQLNEEYNRELAALKDTRRELEQKATATAADYRKEIYAPLIQAITSQVLPEGTDRSVATKLTKRLTKDIQAMTFTPAKDLSTQLSALTKKYPKDPNAAAIITQLAAQVAQEPGYQQREEAVRQWKQEATSNIQQWYTQNTAALTKWKKATAKKAKPVFDKEYSPKMLQAREDAVKKAVQDLWTLKDKAPKAHMALLTLAPVIAQLRTLQGKSFFSQAQITWLNTQYTQILQKSTCGKTNPKADSCNLELTAIAGLGMLSNDRDAAYAIENFMTAQRKTPYAVPTLLTGTTALLAMKQYGVLNGFLYTATRDERDLSNFDILSIENMVNMLANINGEYLGEVSKYAQYPLQENPTDKTALANAWEDVAQLLADNGSAPALEMLRKYGVEQCIAYTEKTISLQEKTQLRCTGIIPFLVGALASGKSGAGQYNPTSVETTPGYVATNHGNYYISPAQAQANANKLAQRKQAFFQYATNMGMSTPAALARHLFLQSMGDLNAESELRIDTKLYQVYQTATKKKAPKPGFAITAYTRNSPQYNAKRARQDRTQFFRKVGRWADIGILIWCVVDITKWSMSGIKIARAMTKASAMARNGATVAQRAMMLRNLNIAPKLRAFISVPGKIKSGIAPSVLAELPHFTSQTIELPRFAGFVESAGTLAAESLRFSVETGSLTADVARMQEAAAGTLSAQQITAFDQMLGTAATHANINFANRSAWQRFFTFNKDASYRSYLTTALDKLTLPSGFSAADLNTVKFRLSSMPIKVPQNITSFQVPSLLETANGMPTLNMAALARVMTTSLGAQPTAEQLVHAQGLFNTALLNANTQFLNRNWLARQWSFLWHSNDTKYRNLLLDNLAAQFDKDGRIFTSPAEYGIYRSIVQSIQKDQSLTAPTFLSQFGHFSQAGSAEGKFHSMGSTLLQTADASVAPQMLPLSFQMQRPRFFRGGIKGVETQAYQRVVITDKNGSFLFGFGNDLSNPLKPSQFKLTLEADDVPAFLRAAQQYTGEPLQLKLTSTSGTSPFSSTFYSKRWTAFTQARADGSWLPLGSWMRGKNSIYVHDIPVQIRLADGSLQTLPVVFKADSYLGLRNASAVLEEGGKLAWYRDGRLVTPASRFSFGLPKNQIRPFLDIVQSGHFSTPLRLTGLSGKNKIQPLMWATGLSLSSASTGLIAPLENVYGDRITEGEKTMISLAFPYLPSLAAPLFSPLVMKIGALRTLQIALGVSTAGLVFTAYKGFSGKLDNQNLPPIWPLYVSGTAIGISSALSRSGLNLLIDSMGGGGTLLKSMAYKNIGSFALLLPPFIANFIDKDIDFSLAFPVLGTLSAGALTWVSASRISSNIGKVDGFMAFKPFELSRPLSWLPTLGQNTWTALKTTGQESWSTLRLLGTKEVLPLVVAATAFTGFEAGAFSKAGNQMIRPNLQSQELPGWVPESNRKNYVSMLTNLSVIAFPLLARFTAKPTLKFLETGHAGDEYRRMLQASFALNATGAGLLYANGFDGYGSLGMLGLGLMGFGTANMTQSFQKLSNISVKSSSYARMLTQGLAAPEKAAMEKSLVTKTMTGFPVQQLGIAIVPTIVSSYTDRQIDEGTIQKSDAAHSSMWIPITSLAVCFGASASRIGLFPTRIPVGMWGLTKGIIGSYPGAINQLSQPQFYLTQPYYGVPNGFSPIPTNPIINTSEIIPSQQELKRIEKTLLPPNPAEENEK